MTRPRCRIEFDSNQVRTSKMENRNSKLETTKPKLEIREMKLIRSSDVLPDRAGIFDRAGGTDRTSSVTTFRTEDQLPQMAFRGLGLHWKRLTAERVKAITGDEKTL